MLTNMTNLAPFRQNRQTACIRVSPLLSPSMRISDEIYSGKIRCQEKLKLRKTVDCR